MCAFRETFSRPVKPVCCLSIPMKKRNSYFLPQIRFLGLFDTVNSVPSFENAWMERSKFPYTARSSAKVIRHAVSIDERRAKFRQDLISQDRPSRSDRYKRRRRKHALTGHTLDGLDGKDEQLRGRTFSTQNGRRDTLAVPARTQNPSLTPHGTRNASPAHTGATSAATSVSNISLDAIQNYQYADSDDEGEQDIREVWFAGCHAVGGYFPF